MAVHVHTVHAPPEVPPDEAAERASFVKDGFSWPFFFFSVFWMLWHRMWLPLFLYLGFLAAIAVLAAGIGFAAFVLAVLGHILFALEANNLRRWTIRRRGWRDIGESFGRNRAEAEIRFFHGDSLRGGLAAQRPGAWERVTGRRTSQGASAVPALPRRRDDDDPGLGLFPEQDR